MWEKAQGTLSSAQLSGRLAEPGEEGAGCTHVGLACFPSGQPGASHHGAVPGSLVSLEKDTLPGSLKASD